MTYDQDVVKLVNEIKDQSYVDGLLRGLSVAETILAWLEAQQLQTNRQDIILWVDNLIKNEMGRLVNKLSYPLVIKGIEFETREDFRLWLFSGLE